MKKTYNVTIASMFLYAIVLFLSNYAAYFVSGTLVGLFQPIADKIPFTLLAIFIFEELYMTPIDSSFEKQIFLLYPYPKRITYTNAQYNEVYIGNEVEGHVVMDVKTLNDLIFSKR